MNNSKFKKQFIKAGKEFTQPLLYGAATTGEFGLMFFQLFLNLGNDNIKVNSNPFSRAWETAEEYNEWLWGPDPE